MGFPQACSVDGLELFVELGGEEVRALWMRPSEACLTGGVESRLCIYGKSLRQDDSVGLAIRAPLMTMTSPTDLEECIRASCRAEGRNR